MLERERTLYAFVLHYCKLLAANISDEQMADQSAPGMNHPAWILGHLAIATDWAGLILKLPRACPPEWHQLFGPGSVVATERRLYPSKEELLAAIEAGHQRVSTAAATVSPERLAQPQTKVFPEHLPTLGDMLAHLMTTHACAHLGQLSAWRRLKGLPAVLGI